MKYKMVVADADGTLLNDKKEITAATKSSIKKFRNIGGIFTLATGRGILSATPYINELNIDVPVILFNGCIIYDPVNKKYYMKNIFQMIYTSLQRIYGKKEGTMSKYLYTV